MDANAPLLVRQQSQAGMEELRNRSIWMIACIGCIMLAPGISCLVIATDYSDGTACTGSYTVDLVTFLEVAGGLQVAIGGLAIFCMLYSLMAEVPMGAAQCNGCIWLFYLIWAAIGLSMYCKEMSSACKSDPVGEMVLAWSVIQYAMIPAICCFVCFMACILGSVVAAAGMAQAAAASRMEAQNEEQAQPLSPNENENEQI